MTRIVHTIELINPDGASASASTSELETGEEIPDAELQKAADQMRTATEAIVHQAQARMKKLMNGARPASAAIRK